MTHPSAAAHRAAFRFLCAAFARPDTPQAAIEPALVAGLDWVEVVRQANRHQVGPALKSRCERRGWWSEVPEDAQTYLALLEQGSIQRNEAVRRQAIELAGLLARAGVPAVLIKSAALLVEAREPLQLARHFKDLDIAVREADAPAARALLEGEGYVPVGDRAAYVGHFHARPLRKVGSTGAVVELHHHLGWQRFMLSTDDLLAESESPAGLGAVRLPAPAHRIVIRCLGAQIQDVGYATGAFALRDLLELADIIRGRGRDIDWPRLARWAGSAGFLPHLSGQVMLMERLLAVSAPPALAGDRRGAGFVARALWVQRSPRRLRLSMRLAGLAVGFSRQRLLYRAASERAPRLRRELVVCAGRLGVVATIVRNRLRRRGQEHQPG